MNLLGQLGLAGAQGAQANSLASLGIPNLGLQGGAAQNFANPLLGGQNNLLGQLGGLGIPAVGGFQQPNQYAPRPPPSGGLIPGSAQHAAAFHQKGPDNEIKLFVGGLAFQTTGMYDLRLNYVKVRFACMSDLISNINLRLIYMYHIIFLTFMFVFF